MHKSAYDKMQAFMEGYLSNYTNDNLKILDVGSCIKENQLSQKDIFKKPNWEYLGLDIEEGINVDIVVKDPYDWKEINTNTFDVVISNQTFEHISFFWVTVFEIGRVLKEGGVACIISPSSGGEHRYPLDTYRYFPDGFSSLADYIGFKKLEIYRQNYNLQYLDGSDLVKDCCIIMQKPILKDFERRNFLIKNYLSKILLKPPKQNVLKNFENFIKSISEEDKNRIINRSNLFEVTSKNVFTELESHLLSQISPSTVRKKEIKACINILINNIFGKKFSKYIFKIYPKMKLWN